MQTPSYLYLALQIRLKHKGTKYFLVALALAVFLLFFLLFLFLFLLVLFVVFCGFCGTPIAKHI